MFAKIGKGAVSNVLNGYNSTVFAYGQTGSGKTFTVTGGAERCAFSTGGVWCLGWPEDGRWDGGWKGWKGWRHGWTEELESIVSVAILNQYIEAQVPAASVNTPRSDFISDCQENRRSTITGRTEVDSERLIPSYPTTNVLGSGGISH